MTSVSESAQWARYSRRSGLDIIYAGLRLAQSGSAQQPSLIPTNPHSCTWKNYQTSASTLQVSGSQPIMSLEQDKESTALRAFWASGTIGGFTEGFQGALSVVLPKDAERDQRSPATGNIPVWHWCAPSRKFATINFWAPWSVHLVLWQILSWSLLQLKWSQSEIFVIRHVKGPYDISLEFSILFTKWLPSNNALRASEISAVCSQLQCFFRNYCTVWISL